jgi:disulfide bond formation protein DsbB
MKFKDRFTLIYMAWLVNIIAFLGSMFFSNVMMLPPCMLCWYQRICIFPLSILLAVGFLKKDKNILFYSLPLVIVGWIISLYHNLLYYKIIPKAIIACTSGVSCTDKQIEYLGFITIPLMAFTSLTITFILFIIFYKQGKKQNEN